MQTKEKKQRLSERMRQYASEGHVCVAFSGGVDSSVVLAEAAEAAKEMKRRVYAVTFHTRLHAAGDMEASQAVAKRLEVIHKVISMDELSQAGIENNPKNRCYLCKRTLFLRLKEFAQRVGAAYCLDGTNADDMNSSRPGLAALRELDIKSPLAELGISKMEVRKLAKELGISVADRPSSPCMATRLPYGAKLDYRLLSRIDQAEQWLRQRISGNVRLRLHGRVVRIEVDKKHLGRALCLKEELVKRLKDLGFHYITLDLEGFRSGSMDE